MFLLRRKEDGLYWRNRGYHQDSSWRACNQKEDGDPRWVDDPSLCKPFATKTAAMICRGASIPSPVQYPTLRASEPGGKKAWAEYWAAHTTWYGKKNRPARAAAFHRVYEVVPVTITVQEAK